MLAGWPHISPPRRRELLSDGDPAPSHSSLRHVAPDPAAIARRDRRLLRGPQGSRAVQLPRVRSRLRLANVGVVQSTWHDAVPGGGPQVGPDRPQGRAASPGADGALPHAPQGSGPSPILVPIRTVVFSVRGGPAWQRAVQAGAEQPAGRGVREGVGPDHDRRAARVFPGGAGADGCYILGSCDGEEEAGIWCDARVPARCESEGGEGVCGGVPVQEVLG